MSVHVVISIVTHSPEAEADAIALLAAVLLTLRFFLLVLTEPVAGRTDHVDDLERRVPQFDPVLVSPIRPLLLAIWAVITEPSLVGDCLGLVSVVPTEEL